MELMSGVNGTNAYALDLVFNRKIVGSIALDPVSSNLFGHKNSGTQVANKPLTT